MADNYRQTVIAVLEAYDAGDPIHTVRGKRMDVLTAHNEAENKGWICTLHSRLTLDGESALFQLKHPVRHWIKQNWFPATIAVVTTMAALAQVGIGIAVMLLRQ